MNALRVLVGLGLTVAAVGQMRDNQEKQMTCESRNSRTRARSCDIREQTTVSLGMLNVNPGQNGGVTVKGWLRNDVLVRAKVETWAENDAAARALASGVYVDTSGGQVQARGPEPPSRSGAPLLSARESGWAVSFEIFVPQATNVTVKAVNGGITLSDIRGTLKFEATNGGVNLSRLAGDVAGSTVNGGVNVELMGTTWDGSQVQVTTKNGGVNISVPENYSAHFHAETVNGSIRSEFPLPAIDDLRAGNRDFSIGSGGPLIQATTTNGGVRVKKI